MNLAVIYLLIHERDAERQAVPTEHPVCIIHNPKPKP